MAPFPPPPTAPCPPAGPAVVDDDAALLPLVEVIELKWLAGGVGLRLHVERMQHDPIYARSVLDAAAASPHAPLRHAATRLRARLRGGTPGR